MTHWRCVHVSYCSYLAYEIRPENTWTTLGGFQNQKLDLKWACPIISRIQGFLVTHLGPGLSFRIGKIKPCNSRDLQLSDFDMVTGAYEGRTAPGGQAGAVEISNFHFPFQSLECWKV